MTVIATQGPHVSSVSLVMTLDQDVRNAVATCDYENAYENLLKLEHLVDSNSPGLIKLRQWVDEAAKEGRKV